MADTSNTPTTQPPTPAQTGRPTISVSDVQPYYLNGVQDGLVAGLGIGFLLLVLIGALLYWRRARQRHSSIVIRGQLGDLTLTRRAIRDIVRESLVDFPDVTVKSVDVRQMGRGHHIHVDIEAARKSRMSTQREAMQTLVIEQLRELAGVEEDLMVAINVLTYSRDPRPLD